MLQKLQNQPENIRKIILWAIVLLVGFLLMIWWGKSFQQRIKSFEEKGSQKESGPSFLNKELKEFLKLEIPEVGQRR